MLAVKNSKTDRALALIAHGADLGCINAAGWSVFHWAAAKDDMRCLTTLAQQTYAESAEALWAALAARTASGKTPGELAGIEARAWLTRLQGMTNEEELQAFFFGGSFASSSNPPQQAPAPPPAPPVTPLSLSAGERNELCRLSTGQLQEELRRRGVALEARRPQRRWLAAALAALAVAVAAIAYGATTPHTSAALVPFAQSPPELTCSWWPPTVCAEAEPRRARPRWRQWLLRLWRIIRRSIKRVAVAPAQREARDPRSGGARARG